jgi:FKBP-type peptidyl-prolyl cis-trans isomerase
MLLPQFLRHTGLEIIMMRFGFGLFLVSSMGIIGCGAEGQKNASGEKTSASDKPGGTVKLPSGLQYEDITIGTGPEVTTGKVIDCFYTGWLKNGTKFDSNVGKKPLSIRVGAGEVIRGWDEGIPGMKEGGKRKLLIPPDMAYGAPGRPPVIPPYSDLIFEVEVVKVK